MKAEKVIELLNNSEYDKLMELAKNEVYEQNIKSSKGVSYLKRQKLIEKYLINNKKIAMKNFLVHGTKTINYVLQMDTQLLCLMMILM